MQTGNATQRPSATPTGNATQRPSPTLTGNVTQRRYPMPTGEQSHARKLYVHPSSELISLLVQSVAEAEGGCAFSCDRSISSSEGRDVAVFSWFDMRWPPFQSTSHFLIETDYQHPPLLKSASLLWIQAPSLSTILRTLYSPWLLQAHPLPQVVRPFPLHSDPNQPLPPTRRT